MFRDGRAQLVVFRLGHERFGIELSLLDEVVDALPLQRIPDAPHDTLGVAMVRGSLVTVYDPRHLLRAGSGESKAALLFVRGEHRAALAVDDVDDAMTITHDELRPAPGVGTDGILQGVVWRGQDLIAVLDGAALLEAMMAVSEGESR